MIQADLPLEFARVVEKAAIAAARTMGQGDRKYADQVAVEAMRKEMETVDIDGTIVIGEGERDEAPMLFIGEKVGRSGTPVDIAVDPLEGTNLCATGASNAIAVLAAAEKGGLLNAPDIYMEKIVVGPSSKGKVDLRAPVEENLKAIAQALDREVNDLVVIVLDRPRHEKLISDIRKAGARIRLIGDGDLSAGISAAVVGTGVHAVMGTGRRPRRRAHRGRHALPERRDPGPARAHQGRGRGSAEEDGHHGPGPRLRDGSAGARPERHLRRGGSHRRDAAQGRPVLRRRHAHALPGHDHDPASGALHRHHPRQGRSGRQDPLLATRTTSENRIQEARWV